jgi:LPXTG-motif cell wall-anchored protein
MSVGEALCLEVDIYGHPTLCAVDPCGLDGLHTLYTLTPCGQGNPPLDVWCTLIPAGHPVCTDIPAPTTTAVMVPPDRPSSLPDTGAMVDGSLWLAIVLLVAGFGAMVGSKRGET